MQASKNYLKEKGVVSRISFKKEPKHIVKLVKDEPDSIKDENGLVTEGMKYTVEENGEQKTFFTSSSSLILALSEKKEGQKVIIEMKNKKGPNGFTSFYEVLDTE